MCIYVLITETVRFEVTSESGIDLLEPLWGKITGEAETVVGFFDIAVVISLQNTVIVTNAYSVWSSLRLTLSLFLLGLLPSNTPELELMLSGSEVKGRSSSRAPLVWRNGR